MATKFLTTAVLILASVVLYAPEATANLCLRKSFIRATTSSDQRPKIVVIAGTNRSGSTTLRVADQVSDVIESQGGAVTLLDIAEIPPSTYAGDRYFNASRNFQRNYDKKIAEADGIVVVFPEYDGLAPGMLLTFLNYARATVQGKPVAMVGLSSGMLGGQKGAEQLSSTFRHRRADVVGEAQVNIPSIDSKLSNGRVVDSEIVGRFEKMARSVLRRASETRKQDLLLNTFVNSLKSSQQHARFVFNSGLEFHGQVKQLIEISGRTAYMEILTEGGRTQTVIPGKLKQGETLVSLSEINSEAAASLNYITDSSVSLNFDSGISVSGIFRRLNFNDEGKLNSFVIENATIRRGRQVIKSSIQTLELPAVERLTEISQ